jgi:hypothetical protein
LENASVSEPSWIDRAFGLAARALPSSRPVAVALVTFIAGTLLIFLYLKTQDSGAGREAEALAALAGVRSIDTRWDLSSLEARSEPVDPNRPVVEAEDLAHIHDAFDAASRVLSSRAVRASAGDLEQAYTEKADLVARFMQANADARQALAAAMRADAALSSLVHGTWREFPQRERLVAIESLVARVLAEAQQYSRAPTAAYRARLQNHAADLSPSRPLPRPVQTGLAHLESDVHQLLLLKPLEETLWARLTALGTLSRLDELAAALQQQHAEGIVSRTRYRALFAVYVIALIVLGLVLGLRALDRYRALEARCAQREGEVSELWRRLEEYEAPAMQGELLEPDEADPEGAIEVGFTPYRRS